MSHRFFMAALLFSSWNLLPAQVATQLVPPQSEIHYAELTADGTTLVVSQQHDTIRVVDARSFITRHILKFKSSENGMNGNSFGEKDFALTSNNRLLCITREIKKDSALLFLQSYSLTDGTATSKTLLTRYYHGILPVYDPMPGYRLTQSGDDVVIALLGQVFHFDAAARRVRIVDFLKNTSQASLAPDKKSFAAVYADSVIIRDARTGEKKSSNRMSTSSAAFLDDQNLMTMGEHALIWNLRTGRIDSIQHGFHTATGVAVGKDGVFVLSGSGTGSAVYNGTFVACLKAGENYWRSIFHLPRTSGITALFSGSGQLWCAESDGRLFRFSLMPDSIPRPVSQRGHKRSPQSIRFSKDRRYMVSTESDGDIILWDILTGRAMERFKTNQHGLSDAFFASNDRDIIYRTSNDYRLIHRGIPSNKDWGLQFNSYLDATSKQQAIAQEKEDEQRISKASDLAQKEGTATQGATAASSTLFIGIDDSQQPNRLKIVHTNTGHVEWHDMPDNISMHYKSDPFVLYDDHTLVLNGAQKTIVFYDLSARKITRRFGKESENLGQISNGIQKVLFSPAGDTLFAVINQRIIQAWNLRNGQQFLKLGIPMRGLNQEDGLNYRAGVMTLFNQSPQVSFAAALRLKNGTGKMMAYTDTSFRTSANGFEMLAEKANGYPDKISLSPDGKQLLMLRLYETNSKTMENHLDLWDLQSGTLTASIKVTDLTFTEWSVSWKDRMVALWDRNATNTTEQKKMRAYSGNDFVMGGMNTNPRIKIIHLQSRRITELDIDKLKSIYRVGNLLFNHANEIWLRDGYHGRLYRINLSTQKITGELHSESSGQQGTVGSHLTADDSNLYYTLTPDSFSPVTELVRYSLAEKRIVATGASGGPEIMYLSEPHPSGVIAVGYSDLTISIRDSKTLLEKYRIVQNETGNFLFLTSGNNYMADRESAGNICFNWNNKSVSMSQFDAWYNRPDKVLDALGFLDGEQAKLLEKAWKKRVIQTGSTSLARNLSQALPEVRLENTKAIPLQTTSDRITITARGKSTDVDIVAWQVLVNGVPIQAAGGKAIKPTKAFQETTELPLTVGENKIQVRCRDARGVESLPDEIIITRTGSTVKPDLYLAAVAINRYQNEAFNLKYAVKDARDMIAFFSKSSQFGKIFVDSVFNENVNAVNVGALKKKFLNARPDDVVVVFLAGHGVLDENIDFRFAAWNIDADRPSETGILYSDLDNLLDGIACRNKIMLIDACHSGQVDKDEIRTTAEEIVSRKHAQGRVIKTTFQAVQQHVFKSGIIDRRGFELMQELFFGLGSATGAQVIVATAGDSYAQESADWNNGVFTYALLSGLKSGDADLDKDNIVRTDELVNYLRNRVKTLTEGEQVPRFREENVDNHFPIWKIR